ncbi:MAG TPA: hypothetical protein VFD39_03890 [Trueperaceae bacterium]|nr:hypothetical protein [Trueperaceae bacterium]
MNTVAKTVTISEARHFSLDEVQRRELASHPDLGAELLCFEAGQSLTGLSSAGTVAYQVLEGEALLRTADERSRLGKGKLTFMPPAQEHSIENAGGGLLVVLATAAR